MTCRNQIIVDCGVMFPESDMYGIDLVLPQFDYVVDNQKTLRGIVLTHGHMDHVGGLPYLLKRITSRASAASRAQAPQCVPAAPAAR